MDNKIATKDIIFNSINELDKIKDKQNLELLLVTLLEYFCVNNGCTNELFQSICQYLRDINMLKTSADSNDFSHIRHLYINSLKGLLINYKKKNNILCIKQEDSQVSSDQLFNSSRYYNDFIQFNKLGNGGFGIVYKAFNKFDKHYYAIKKIFLQESFDKVYREIKFLSSLNHPNIVRYYNSWIEFDPFIYDDINKMDEDDYFVSNTKSDEFKINPSNPTLFIQMQLCNYTLKDWINKRQNLTINKDINIKIFTQILNGVQYIHQNKIIHRDLKPTNIFLSGDDLQVKIGDFGLATQDKTYTSDKLLSSTKGTFLYTSPEQENRQDFDNKTDIYSLGIILFELFYPFDTQMERAITLNKIKTLSELPNEFINNYPKISNLILNMIHKDQNKRLNIQQTITNFHNLNITNEII